MDFSIIHTFMKKLEAMMSDMRHVCMMRAALVLSSFGLVCAFMPDVLSAGEFPETVPCYGVCAHVVRGDYNAQSKTFEMARVAGIDAVRCDIAWSLCQKEPGGKFDFSRYDELFNGAEAAGIEVLPIVLYPPKWARPAHKHIPELTEYTEALMLHLRGRIRAIEAWNEPNLKGFWHDEPNPTNYLAALSAVYKAVKRIDPSVRVMFGGTSTIPFDWIREIYRLGGAKYFDAMSVHPYCRWFAPEGLLDADLEKLRSLMAEYGDGKKPIVITELGWATHSVGVDGEALRAGLAAARPEKKAWNVVFAATAADSDGKPSPDVAAAIEEALPTGSQAEVCLGARLRARLAAGDVDAVMYPFDESFPVDTADDVFEFVKGGGTLVCLRGMPMYFAVSETSPGVFAFAGHNKHWAMRQRLRIAESAWWIDPNIPKSGFAFPTDAARAAGFKCDPAGVSVNRFQTPKLLKPGDEWVPLLTLKDKSGREAVAASVVRFNSDMKGRLVVFGTTGLGLGGTCDESTQAKYLVRSLAIALAEGVEACYWYEFRAPERNATYSEWHFGLVHANFSPKPAYGAYMNFVAQRPRGSVQSTAPWHDGRRTLFFPQWTRPDGTKAGVIWRKGAPERVLCRFDSNDIHFADHAGKSIHPARVAPGVYKLRTGEAPVFFSGGAYLPSERESEGQTRKDKRK